MWLPNSVIAEVDRVARIAYIDKETTALWNERRKAGELRALTGWSWTAKDSSGRYAHRIKSKTACYIDAAEHLLGYSAAVALRPRLRLVANRRAA